MRVGRSCRTARRGRRRSRSARRRRSLRLATTSRRTSSASTAICTTSSSRSCSSSACATQQTYGSLDELKAAIADDVATSLQIAGFSADPEGEPDPYEAPFSDELADGSPVVTDPAALEAAEQAASHSAPVYFDDIATGEWKAVVGPLEFYGALGAGPKAFMVVAPLEVAGIPYVWDPYPPDQRPQGLPGAGAYDQPFTLLVPAGSSRRHGRSRRPRWPTRQPAVKRGQTTTSTIRRRSKQPSRRCDSPTGRPAHSRRSRSTAG